MSNILDKTPKALAEGLSLKLKVILDLLDPNTTRLLFSKITEPIRIKTLN